ncbi:MAG TPA: LamG domain-containing protein [Polyangiaceae bacterium]|jgi:hypothetical protein
MKASLRRWGLVVAIAGVAACSLVTDVGDLRGDAAATPDASSDAAPSGIDCDADGLVAYWPLDEGAGITVADCKGLTNGKLAGAVGWGADNPTDGGHCLVFDGGGGSVGFPSNGSALEIGAPFTISLWVNADPSTGPANQDFAVRYTMNAPAWGVGLRVSDDRIYFAQYPDAGGSSVLSLDTFPPNAWNHVAAVFNSSFRATLYVNGFEEASSTAGGDILASSTPLLLGVSGVGNTSLHGRLAKVAFFARALSQSEVQAIFQAR